MNISEVYQELEVIKENEYKKLSLVRNQIDNLLYFKREIEDYNKSVYSQLLKMDSNYFPKIYQVQEIENKIIIIEEYINAPTLEEVLLNEQLSKEKALDVFYQVCNAVEQLHRLLPPIIHRDIKPGNIFYDEGHIYLFDFDISRNYQIHKNNDTHILGSVGYAAPEQFGFGQSNKQSDIYALGVLLNVLLTNKLPNELIYMGRESKIIRRATNMDPSQRYMSVRGLINDLGDGDKQVNESDISPALPGLRNSSKFIRTLVGLGYLSLLLFCFSAPVTSNGAIATGLIAWLYRFYMYVMFMTIVLVGGNYRNIHRQCLFFKSRYKIVRFVGIVLAIVLIVFLELIFLSLVIAFLGIG